MRFIYVYSDCNDVSLYYDLCSRGARVALKIIKNIERYRDAAMSEVEVLEHVNSLDSSRK